MLPIHGYEPYIRQIKKHLSPGATVVTLQSQGGIRALFNSIEPERYDLNLVLTAHFPLTCRTLEFGKSVAVYAEKDIEIAIVPNYQPKIHEMMQKLFTGSVGQLEHSLSAALAPVNWALHTPIVLRWLERESQESLTDLKFYYDLDDQAFAYMRAFNAELKVLISAIHDKEFEIKIPANGDLLEFMSGKFQHVFGDREITSLEQLLRENPAFSEVSIPTDGSGRFDKNARVLWEDVPFGLFSIYAIGMIVFGQAEVSNQLPEIKKALLYFQAVMQKEYLDPQNPLYLGNDYQDTGAPQANFIFTMEDMFAKY